jgi:hypothetical protein
LIAARNMVRSQQENPQHNEDINGDNNRISGAGKRALSYRVEKNHVNTRIQGLVKTATFRKCKFITSQAYYNKAMVVVIDSKKPADPVKFVRMYKTCALGSLSPTRSSCQQAASDCVKALSWQTSFEKVDPPPYSIDMLCKPRQSQAPAEKEAFL